MFEYIFSQRDIPSMWVLLTFFVLAALPCFAAWFALKRKRISDSTAVFLFATFGSSFVITLKLFSETHSENAYLSLFSLVFVATLLECAFAAFTASVIGLPALLFYKVRKSRSLRVLGCADHRQGSGESVLAQTPAQTPMSVCARALISVAVLISVSSWAVSAMHEPDSSRFQDNYVLEKVTDFGVRVARRLENRPLLPVH